LKNWKNEELLKIYDMLKTARVFSISMEKAVYAGLLKGAFHTPIGQEATTVALSATHKNGDWLGYTHRGQIILLNGYGLKPLITELFGRAGGYSRGSQFDFHISNYCEDGPRILGQPGTLGSYNPQHVGFALGRKLQGKNEVVVTPLGDGAASEGYVYEAFNLAALYKAPIVFVLENNGWGLSVPARRMHANLDFAAKGRAFGLKTIEVKDGCDVLEIYESVETAMEWARNGEPTLVVINNKRWGPHFIGEGSDHRDDLDEVEDRKINNDCVKKLEKILIERKIADQAYFDKKEEEVKAMMDDAYNEAAESRLPVRDDMYYKEMVYATPETGGDL